MLKRVRDILDMITALGFSENAVSDVADRLQPTFEEFFGLLILMQYYFHLSSNVSLVIEEFYQRYRQKFINQYPNDNRIKRMLLVRTNTSIIASQLKNETDLEMVTKSAIRELFG